MAIRLDRVAFTTTHEPYQNYETKSSLINISGSVASLATVNFSTAITYERGGTRADVYLDGNSVKRLANASTALATGEVYQYVSTENADVFVEYDTNSIDVTISIFNGTGGPITLTTQTITASAVLYDAPITAV